MKKDQAEKLVSEWGKICLSDPESPPEKLCKHSDSSDISCYGKMVLLSHCRECDKMKIEESK